MNELSQRCPYCLGDEELNVNFNYSAETQEASASISRQKKELAISTYNGDCQVNTFWIKIKYCPMCGRKLRS